MHRRLLTLIVICLAWAVPAGAEEPGDLDAIQRSLEKERAEQEALKTRADRLASERAALRKKLIAAARTAQEREALVASLEPETRLPQAHRQCVRQSKPAGS